MGVSAVDLYFLAFGEDSSFQNLSEFIGAILAVIEQIMLGLSGCSLALRGDSVTALTWAIIERPRGSIVTNASMVWILLSVATEIDVREVIHIAGEDNGKCDRLSRSGVEPKMSVMDEAADMGITGAAVVEIDRQEAVINILRMCDPRTVLTSESDFDIFWTKTRSTISTSSPCIPHIILIQEGYKKEIKRGPFFFTLIPYIRTDTGGKGLIFLWSKKDLSAFMSASVLPKTNKVYNGHFKMWTEFVKSEVKGDDPFLRGVAE